MSSNPKLTSISNLEGISSQVGLVHGQAVNPTNDVALIVTGAGSYDPPLHHPPS